MAKYAANNLLGGSQQNLSSSFKTITYVVATTGATTLRRGWIYDLTVGTDGTPADNAMVFYANRQTSVGTGTTVVAPPLDTGDAAALLVCTANVTIEPIITAVTHLLTIPMNQRASYRWVAAPGGELVVPAVNVAGIGVRAYSPAYTGTAMADIHFWE